MQDNDLNIVRGDTFYFGVEFTGLNTSVTSLTFTVKSLPDDESPIFQYKIGDGISLRSSSTGDDDKLSETYFIRIAPEDTKDLDIGNYYYDLEFQQSNQVFSDTYTLLRGKFIVEYDVTQHNS